MTFHNEDALAVSTSKAPPLQTALRLEVIINLRKSTSACSGGKKVKLEQVVSCQRLKSEVALKRRTQRMQLVHFTALLLQLLAKGLLKFATFHY